MKGTVFGRALRGVFADSSVEKVKELAALTRSLVYLQHKPSSRKQCTYTRQAHSYPTRPWKDAIMLISNPSKTQQVPDKWFDPEECRIDREISHHSSRRGLLRLTNIFEYISASFDNSLVK
ncbi:hypothetical protein CKAN_01267600 [Cinnamomum micranthum f. kanehirae]|uniref:Uncharacterized protein n=1 Tax=Cinnamomum micranthum f. kanehirae TaxID=337451 RepID=A0A443NZG4_9MAGN|nr:hypothetical protein CKAN_01267600 [Cinnamomum micranthum f. kanehirae]